jgi:uncharacterized delta-60 repeat protein
MRFRFLTAFVLALFVTPSWAAPGDLDLTFGGTGEVTTSVGSSSDRGAHSVIQQADGKLVVAGNSYFSGSSVPVISLVRYNTNGSLDTSFDGDGKLSVNIAGRSYKMIQQSDGKLVLAGYSDVGGQLDIALLRFDADGTFDASFDVDGKVTTDIAGYDESAYSVIQQADGKLVIAGAACVPGCHPVVVRYNNDGTLDTSFNGDGKLVTDMSGAGYNIIQQLDGKLVLLSKTVIARYNSDGSLDQTFAVGGKFAVSDASSIIQQADGKLVVAGNPDAITGKIILLRFTSDGALDNTFDSDGEKSFTVAPFTSGISEPGIICSPCTGRLYVPETIYQIPLIQQADGQLVIAVPASSNYFELVTFHLDGSINTIFDSSRQPAPQLSSSVYCPVQPTEFFLFAGALALLQQTDGQLVATASDHASTFLTRRYKSAQGDADSDGAFDESDLDDDADGESDDVDNCSLIANVDQLDTDRDGIGDVCDIEPYGSPAGSLDVTFNPGIGVNGAVYSVAQQTDGKVLIAGDFNSVGGVNRNSIARLNSDGSLDTTFDPGTGANDFIYAVALQTDGKVIISGRFSSVNSVVRDGIARLNIDGSLDISFNPDLGVSGFSINSLAVQVDGKIIIAGHFMTVNGVTSNNIARLNIDGSTDTTFDKGTSRPRSSVVSAIALQSDGKVLIGGLFNNPFDAAWARNGLARLNSDGTLDSSFNANASQAWNIYAIAFQANGSVLVSADFYVDNVGARNDVVRFNYDGSLDTAFNTGAGINGQVNVLTLQSDGKLIIGGSFTSVNGLAHYTLARLDNNGSLDSTFNYNTCNDTDSFGVYSVALRADGAAIIGGDFAKVNGVARKRIARIHTGDLDYDGIENAIDNCVSVSNADQLNTDGDSEGNACDSDDDDDGVDDITDAFPLDATEFVDTDGDGIGDNADTTPNGDTDNDGIDNATDNCVSVSNIDQLNTDGDSEGNACDNDDDNDGVADTSDAFPLDATESVDTDSDTIGDNADNCVAVANTNQLDTDADGAGDVCDATPNGDTDNDGIDNLTDNCVSVSNVDQLNTDGDAQGNACDNDDDNDGVQDISDNCPLTANSNQLDYDADNIGDACDDAVPVPEDIAGVMKNAKAGSSVAFAGDVNGDGYGDYVIGMPGYDIPAAPPVKTIQDAGRAEVISGKTGAVLMSVNGVAAKDAMGFAVAGNGDIDNDGFDDVLVGAPNADDFAFGVADAGSATILFGPDGIRTKTFIGKSKKSLSGSAVALANVNGDNHADIIIGAPKADDVARSLVDAGIVTVISGNGYSVLNTLYVAKEKSHAGSSVAAGDINHDGKADIIIGAPNDDDATNNLKDAGSVSVYDISGTELMRKYGAVANAHFGKAVASGDVNNDDFDDVLVGAPDDDNAKLKDAGSVTVYSGSDGSSLIKKFGAVAKINLGNSVAAGDVNADSYADIIVGAWKDDSPIVPKALKDAGGVSVWSGNGYALIDTVYGDAAHDYFGTAVSAGDINSDGKFDLIIGIPGFDTLLDTKPVKDAGAVRVLSGAGLGF